MVIVDETSNNFYVNTLRSVHIENDSILSKILQYSNTYTNADANMLPYHQYVT
jgi:hypothetical protein